MTAQAVGAPGDHARAADELLPLVYDDLRRLARSSLARYAPGQRMQPTGLVHEAYVRLVGSLGGRRTTWSDCRQFCLAAARAMHDVIVERARRNATLKRGGDRRRVDAKHLVEPLTTPPEDMLALEHALEHMERTEPDSHQMVMLRFFAGLTQSETARVLGVSVRTVERRWCVIRNRLYRELVESESPAGGEWSDRVA